MKKFLSTIAVVVFAASMAFAAEAVKEDKTAAKDAPKTEVKKDAKVAKKGPKKGPKKDAKTPEKVEEKAPAAK